MAAIYGLRATWGASSDAYLREYEVQYRVTPEDPADPLSDGLWQSGGAVGDMSAPSWERAVTTGVEYDVRVRVKREDGTVGPWATETNILVSGDVEPPANPTALSVTGTGTHTIVWTNPASLDVMRARVYASTTNNSATATEVAEVFGLPSTAYTATHTPASVPTHYWVTSVDRSGNSSARTYAGAGG